MATGESTKLQKRNAAHGGLQKYNPERGVKQIAGFEAAEKHFARAKDASKLEQAIRAKLEAQAEFVLWWKTLGPGADKGGSRQGSGRKKSK